MSYRWSIEGPTAGGFGETLNRPFRREGNYEVELTVRDDDGETDTATETIEVTSPRPISDTDDSSDSTDSSEEDEGSDGGSTGESESESNDPPSADIAASRTSGTAPLSVEFDAGGSSDSDGSIEEYEWNIEGQADASGQVIDREFTEPGSYEVELTVTDNDGAESTTSITIDVNAPPTASATADPPSGSAPLNVEFDGSGSSDPDGEIVRYRWQIDGPTPGGTGETITRRFQTRGSYDVTLTVTDDDGATDETTITVDVSGRLGKIEFNLI
jgi:PKD repeat protein